MTELTHISVPIFKKLKHGDYTITPFQAFKTYRFTNTDYSSSYGVSVMKAIYPLADGYPKKRLMPSSSRYTRLEPSQSVDPKIMWHSINHLYYKNGISDVDFAASSLTNVNMVRNLYGTASIMSYPQRVFGEGIRPNSIQIDDYSYYDGSTDASIVKIRDDGYGNLFDISINSSSFANTDYLYGYWGFNERFADIDHSTPSTKYVRDWSTKANHGITRNVSYQSGVTLSGTGSGVSAYFTGSYMQVHHIDDYKLAQTDDFAISMWIKHNSSQPLYRTDSDGDTTVTLISKQVVQNADVYSNQDKTVDITEVSASMNRWPFRIDMAMSASVGKIKFSRRGGNTLRNVSTGYSVTGSSYQHILCQKSGSLMQVYLNGVLQASGSSDVNGSVTNKCDILVGAYDKSSGMYCGNVDEVRFYKTALTTSEIVSLANTSSFSDGVYQTSQIGNAIYKNGVVVVTDPRPKYKNVFTGATGQYDFGSNRGFNVSTKGIVTLYEHEALCKIRASEFNFSMNPSLRENGDDTEDVLRSFVSSSAFTPYITTVGLYDDDYQLLAVAKLASPVPKRSDVDLTIILRWDV